MKSITDAMILKREEELTDNKNQKIFENMLSDVVVSYYCKLIAYKIISTYAALTEDFQAERGIVTEFQLKGKTFEKLQKYGEILKNQKLSEDTTKIVQNTVNGLFSINDVVWSFQQFNLDKKNYQAFKKLVRKFNKEPMSAGNVFVKKVSKSFAMSYLKKETILKIVEGYNESFKNNEDPKVALFIFISQVPYYSNAIDIYGKIFVSLCSHYNNKQIPPHEYDDIDKLTILQIPPKPSFLKRICTKRYKPSYSELFIDNLELLLRQPLIDRGECVTFHTKTSNRTSFSDGVLSDIMDDIQEKSL